MARKRIFVAADEQLLPALAMPLRKAGMLVETFSKQADLIPATRIDPPDAMLLSAKLADGGALSVIQALAPVGSPPTVVVLAQSQLASRPELLRAGIRNVIVSPIKPKALAATMAEAAGGVRRVEPRDRVAIPVVVEWKDRRIGGVTVDISRDGLGLSLWEPIDSGVVLGVTLTAQATSLKVWGRVVHTRSEGDRTHVGVRLLGLVSEEEHALLKLARPAAATG